MTQQRSGEVVSVVIPTYHRPERLELAVRSVLEQSLPEGKSVEVIVAVSDAQSVSDLTAANALSADPRVIVAVAAGLGPARARNAGIAASHGSIIAFMDDDCIAQPGWLEAGVAALESADIVQGQTEPEADVPMLYHAVSIYPPSWLWETCNLMVRASAVERAGVFDEAWNPTGSLTDHFGEDVEWGWRLVRAGATYAFEPGARVSHAVTPRDLGGFVRYQARSSLFPMLLRSAPEVRRRFYHRYFMNKRHLVLTASTTMLLMAVLASTAGARTQAWLLLAGATAGYLMPLRKVNRSPLDEFLYSRVAEGVQFAALLYGSARWRRLLL